MIAQQINAALCREERREQGFKVFVLRSEGIELGIVPELGARIISLKDLKTGREWLWHPAGGLKLFQNRLGDDFARGPLAGVDECLPTIGACAWRGRNLADHGEVWSQPWTLHPAAWADGLLTASIRLSVSPFAFQRSILLRGREILLHYELCNHSPRVEPFVWALHPLLRLRPGDCLALPASTRELLNGHRWLDAVDTAIPAGGCSKLFAGPLARGEAGIHNDKTGERLDFEWDATQNSRLGLWLTRGGWNGHDHFAIEPTNSSDDSLGTAASRGECGTVPPNGSVNWQVKLILHS